MMQDIYVAGKMCQMKMFHTRPATHVRITRQLFSVSFLSFFFFSYLKIILFYFVLTTVIFPGIKFHKRFHYKQ